MCKQCLTATASMIVTVLAAGAPAFVESNRQIVEKHFADAKARGQTVPEPGDPKYDGFKRAMEATERGLAFLSRMSSAMYEHKGTHEERIEMLKNMVYGDMEKRVDSDALCAATMFAHQSIVLFASLRNVLISGIDVRAETELDERCVKFALGRDGQEIRRGRDKWNAEEAVQEVIDTVGSPPGFVVLGGMQEQPRGTKAPKYEH
jgi:hypothetical protein